jgi:hypothetical protein
VALQVLQIAGREDVGEGVDLPHRAILATSPHANGSVASNGSSVDTGLVADAMPSATVTRVSRAR